MLAATQYKISTCNRMPRRSLRIRVSVFATLVLGLGCGGSGGVRAKAGTFAPGDLPVVPQSLGFLVQDGRHLIRGLGWTENLASDVKTWATADGRAKDAVTALFERFRKGLESSWAATQRDPAKPRCIDGSTRCWLWVDTCTLKAATILDRFEEGGTAFAVAEIELGAFRVCVDKQTSLNPDEQAFVLKSLLPTHTALTSPETAAELKGATEKRWQRYREALAKGQPIPFDPGGGP